MADAGSVHDKGGKHDKAMPARFEAAKAAWDDMRKSKGGGDIDRMFAGGDRLALAILPPQSNRSQADDPVPPIKSYTFYRGKAMMLDPVWGWLKCDAIVTHNNQLVEQLGDWEKAT